MRIWFRCWVRRRFPDGSNKQQHSWMLCMFEPYGEAFRHEKHLQVGDGTN